MIDIFYTKNKIPPCSFFSSIYILFIGLVLVLHKRELISFLCLFLGITSTITHSTNEGWWIYDLPVKIKNKEDINLTPLDYIRFIDWFLVVIFGSLIFFYFNNKLIFWISSLICGFLFLIPFFNIININKSLTHCLIHIIAISSAALLILKKNKIF